MKNDSKKTPPIERESVQILANPATTLRLVGHVAHGNHADALEQSEASFRTLSRERDLSVKNDRQVEPGLRTPVTDLAYNAPETLFESP
ncbi:hypothetical protein CEE69_24630 [Rhodopirellula bahusiensis]|uniref:Uncharacterized protein n=1 Tax=Rhodopirellula bahusiensis TaxID=2014065 RepID=A0A2G1W0T0_9BACT|nr:hypothetical protein CEE69_24630 [Rhodopirellula bahusiensis]